MTSPSTGSSLPAPAPSWMTSVASSCGIAKSPESDLNRRSLPYHGSALPTELSGRALTVARDPGGDGSGVQGEALAVHAGRGIGTEEGDRVGEVLGGSEAGTGLVGVGFADLGSLDGVDDDDVGGCARAHEGVREREGPGLGRRLGGGVGRVGVLGHLRGGGGDQDEAAVLAAGQGGVEGAGGELEGADEQAVEEVVVGQVEGVDGVAAAVAADEVEEPVDLSELLLRGGGPVAGLGLVEEVDRAGVHAVAGKAEALGDGVGDLLAAVREGEGGAGVGEAAGDDRAEAAARAGDSDDPSVEIRHGVDAIRPSGTLPTLSSHIRSASHVTGNTHERMFGTCPEASTREVKATWERQWRSSG